MEVMQEGEHVYGEQTFKFSAVCFRGHDGHRFVKPWVGALQGDPWAVKVFVRDIGDCFEEAQA
eukprot:2974772-Pyramimonas_sp.AAC.1